MDNFLKKLQSLDESAKQKVLIGATAVIMAIVVFAWITYFNNLMIPSLQAQGVSSTVTAAPTLASSGGFWSNFTHSFTNLVHGGHQYITPSASP